MTQMNYLTKIKHFTLDSPQFSMRVRDHKLIMAPTLVRISFVIVKHVQILLKINILNAFTFL
jgi:hypothetical protein